MTSKYIKGDIHQEIYKLESNSIDLIYTNPPYGTTSAKWDDLLFYIALNHLHIN